MAGAAEALEARRRERRTTRPSPFKLGSGAVAVALAVLALAPVVAVLVRLVYTDGAIDLSPIADTLALDGLGSLLADTAIVVTASGALALAIGTMLAWINERTDARLGLLTDAMPMIPFLVPPIAGAIAWVLLLSPDAGYANALIRGVLGLVGVHLDDGPLDIYSWYGLIGVYTIYQVPYAFMLASAGLRTMDPSLEEQSEVSGAGLLRTLRRVTVPAILPNLAGAVLLMTWSGFGLFSIPSIIGTGAHIDVLSVKIVNLLSFTYPPRTGVAVGLSLIMVLFVGVTWWAHRRVLRRARHATIGGKGARIAPIRLGAWRRPARGLMLAYVAVTTVLPMVALLLVSLSGFWTAHVRWSHLGLDALREAVVENDVTQQALENSLLLGAVGATVGILAAAVLALFVARTSPRLGRLVDATVKFPSTLSHIVLAVGFLLVFAGPPLRLGGTLAILLMGYLALYLPQAAVAADGAVGQVGRDLPDASHVCGAGEGRTFRRVYLPLMVPGLVAGWAMLFVRMVGDLTASSILAGTTNPVVGRQILEIYLNGSYALLASLATVLTAITAVVTIVVLWATRRRMRWSAAPGALGAP